MKTTPAVKMVRLSVPVHKSLKEYCEEEGRKMEWAVNTACIMWLMLKNEERDYLRRLYAEKGPVLQEEMSDDESLTV